MSTLAFCILLLFLSFIPRSGLKFTHDWLPTVSSEGLLGGSQRGRKLSQLVRKTDNNANPLHPNLKKRKLQQIDEQIGAKRLTKENFAQDKRNSYCLLGRQTNSPSNISTKDLKKEKCNKELWEKKIAQKKETASAWRQIMQMLSIKCWPPCPICIPFFFFFHQMFLFLFSSNVGPPALSVFLSFSFIPRSGLKFTHDWLPP